jgi:hypothetical protein
MRPLTYFGWIAGTMALLAISVVFLTVATDPYRTFGTPAITGWTALKPRAYQQIGMAKLYQLDRIAPQTLILGNSRAEIGLDPASPLWPVALRPAFNAAVAGGSVYTSLLMLREGLAVRPPARIVIGLDLQDFLSGETQEPIENERRLLVDAAGTPNPRRYYQVWKDRFASTLTIDAVADSVLTLFDQDPLTSATMTRFGFNPLHEYRVFAKRSGYQGLFSQKNAIYRQQYAGYAQPDFVHPTRIAAYRDFVSILKQAMGNHIPVIVYIHPYHAEFLLMLDELGRWKSFEEWKRVVVNAVAQAIDDSPGAITLFDFSGFNEFTIEPVPPPGDRKTEMSWYWEPGHYKSALGEQILTAMFHEGSRFGRILTPENIESVLGEIRRERTEFKREARPAFGSYESDGYPRRSDCKAVTSQGTITSAR